MNVKLSNDVEQLVIKNPTGVIQVEGASGTYYVMTDEAMRVRQHVLEGIKQADKGDVSLWDTEGIISKASCIKEQQSS